MVVVVAAAVVVVAAIVVVVVILVFKVIQMIDLRLGLRMDFSVANNDLFTKMSPKHICSQFYEWLRSSMKKACSDHWLFWSHVK